MASREQLIDCSITRLHESVDGNTSPLSQKSKATGTNSFFYMALLEVAQARVAARREAQASGIGLQ